MIASMLALALQAAAPAPPAPAPSPPPGGELRGLVQTFDMLCNHVFPEDARVDTLMETIAGVRPLTPQEVRTYLKDDPGRGWMFGSGPGAIVFTIERPPFHACAVRMGGTNGRIDERMWHAVVDAAKARSGGNFTALPPRTFTIGNVRSTAMGEQKRNADGSAEAFYLIRAAPADPALAGPGVELRLVHQLVAPGAR